MYVRKNTLVSRRFTDRRAGLGSALTEAAKTAAQAASSARPGPDATINPWRKHGTAQLHGWWDDTKAGFGSILGFYNQAQQSQGAAQALQAQNAAMIQGAMAAQQGPDMMTLLLLGGVGVAAYMLLRKKHA